MFFKWSLLSPNCFFTAYYLLKERQIWVYKRSYQAGITWFSQSPFGLDIFITVDTVTNYNFFGNKKSAFELS